MSNKKLKIECENLTKEILQIKNGVIPESKKAERNIYTSRGDESEGGLSRNSASSTDIIKSVSKSKRK